MEIKKCDCHCGCDYKLEDYGKDEKMCGACLDNCLMEITIDYEEVVGSRIDKDYTLLVGKKEIEVEVSKHWYEYAKEGHRVEDYGNDYTILTDEDYIKKQLSEKEYNNLLDYIDELK